MPRYPRHNRAKVLFCRANILHWLQFQHFFPIQTWLNCCYQKRFATKNSLKCGWGPAPDPAGRVKEFVWTPKSAGEAFFTPPGLALCWMPAIGYRSRSVSHGPDVLEHSCDMTSGPWSPRPRALTALPGTQVCGSQALHPSLCTTATRIASSDSSEFNVVKQATEGLDHILL